METSSSSAPLAFSDFLNRMRHPASVDLVRSIKSFIVSFSFHPTNSEADSKRVQEFLMTMEAAIKDHPLWHGAFNEEIENAIEGLEKYVMTKLYNRTFASTSEDIRIDKEVSEKIRLLQHFIKPEHLDMPTVFHDEASWLMAEKELQKINAFKAPREKLVCVLNCCKVINNLLLTATLATGRTPSGADDFLPVLIYITIKANPPQLHSNLKFIQLFMKQTKLISEAAYYLTNLVSAKLFIVNLDSSSLSMDNSVFEESMRAAKLADAAHSSSNIPSSSTSVMKNIVARSRQKDMYMDADFYPYMEAEAADLTAKDVQKLLIIYKSLVNKYTLLREAVRGVPLSMDGLSLALREDIVQPRQIGSSALQSQKAQLQDHQEDKEKSK